MIVLIDDSKLTFPLFSESNYLSSASKNFMFIFGYGSLINSESRKRTGKSGAAYPVSVVGIERRWGAQITLPTTLRVHNDISKFSAVSVNDVVNSTAWANGVLVAVTDEELKKFDDREIGYKRIKVGTHRIQPYPVNGIDFPDLTSADVWCYVMPKSGLRSEPSPEYPICQTYLDVILQGCDEISSEFTRDFLKTTADWGVQGSYIDDRQHPGYPRFDTEASSGPNANKFDRLMQELQCAVFDARVVGPTDETRPQSVADFQQLPKTRINTLSFHPREVSPQGPQRKNSSDSIAYHRRSHRAAPIENENFSRFSMRVKSASSAEMFLLFLPMLAGAVMLLSVANQRYRYKRAHKKSEQVTRAFTDSGRNVLCLIL